ncbi:hypothetical protein EV356DRAFT_499866 [Viridothelium virens]|uniref:Uncharacterized protein n=1 Tax=Viridothelium virens TaxID=1048519 RepID=A0A6A6HQF0_VIRVR|nr:hypothetical protein EV356DRAFT_499866 [Viridothelium virens]
MSEVTKSGGQQITKPAQQAPNVEQSEQTASASAKAGVNLNLFAAVSGIFGSKTQKETKPDGSSTENTQSAGRVKGAGVGNMSAVGEANAQTTDRRLRANAAPQAVEAQSQQAIEDRK